MQFAAINALWNIFEFPRNVDCNYIQGFLNRTWYFTWHFLWIKLNMYSIWHLLEIRYQVKVSQEGSQKFPLNVTYEKFALIKFLVKCKTVAYVWMRLLSPVAISAIFCPAESPGGAGGISYTAARGILLQLTRLSPAVPRAFCLIRVASGGHM